MSVAHLGRLVNLLEVVDWPAALLLERLGREQVLLGGLARDFHRRVRLLKLVELLTDFDFRRGRHRLRRRLLQG